MLMYCGGAFTPTDFGSPVFPTSVLANIRVHISDDGSVSYFPAFVGKLEASIALVDVNRELS